MLTRKAICKYFKSYIIFYLLGIKVLYAQTGIYGLSLGGTLDDGHNTLYHTKFHIDNAGNQIMYGSFESSTMSLNPPLNTVNITNAGMHDMYLAKYDVNHNLLWGFRIGGLEEDGICDATTDAQGDVYVCGYFRNTVDFDPSAATYSLSCPVSNGFNSGYGGDIFLAKYSSNGAFQWAFSIGDANSQELGLGVKVAANGNIFLVGQFNSVCDFDPGAGTTILSPLNGRGFVAKYSNAGNFIDAFNFGGPNQNTSVQQIELLANGNIAVVGSIDGSSVDMDPSSAGTFIVSSTGNEAFIAIYDTVFNFINAYVIPSSSPGICVDADTLNGFIYITGWLGGTGIDFDPSTNVSNQSTLGSDEIFIVKYSNNLTYQWSAVTAGPMDDRGYGIEVKANRVYCVGYFKSTCDFDPTAGVDYVNSAFGSSDGFLTIYDTAGLYLCTRKFGGNSEDEVHGVFATGVDSLYIGGHYTTNASFANTGVFQTATSNGVQDVFLFQLAYTCTNVVVDTINAAFTFNDPTPCNNNYTVNFTNASVASSGIASYLWHFGDPSSGTANSSILQNPTHTFSSAGIYTVTLYVTSNTGLVDSIQDVVVINTMPSIVLPSPGYICPGGSYTINAITNAQNILWAPSSSLNNATSTSPVATPTSTTTYTVTISDGFNCTTTVTYQIIVYPKPTANAGADTFICANGGNPVVLTATGGVLYNWQGPGGNTSNSATIQVTAANVGIYTVTVTSVEGCTATDVVSVAVGNSTPISFSAKNYICIGDTTSILLGSANTYTLAPDPSIISLGANPIIVNPSTTTTYSVTATNAQGCTTSATVTIYVGEPPTIIAQKSGDILCNTSRPILTASGGNFYSWSPIAGLSSDTGVSVICFATATTTYTVTGSNTYCASTSTIKVNVLEEENRVFIPNAFTPNNDGLNDCLHVRAVSTIQSLDFKVYDRWGRCIYANTDPSFCWDGTVTNGIVDANDGVYFYHIRAITDCGTIIKSGDLLITR